MSTPKVTGNWQPADTSRNHIELAPTEEPNVFALRDTFDPGAVTHVTKNQIMNLAESVQKGTINRMLQGRY